jgi:hypothetical protein
MGVAAICDLCGSTADIVAAFSCVAEPEQARVCIVIDSFLDSYTSEVVSVLHVRRVSPAVRLPDA